MFSFSTIPRRVLMLALLAAAPAAAERRGVLDHLPELVGLGTPCVTAPMPPEAFTPHAGQISPVLYLERCIGGCTVQGGQINDARSMTSAIPPPGSSTAFPEFANHLGETGAAADAEWDALIACVREVYSYYQVQVTDQKPTAGLSYHMNIVSGSPGLIGLGASTLGISPFACTAQDNIISFSFAAAHQAATAAGYVQDLCWTAAHEAGHAFSLEHAWTFVDGRTACTDPMSYPTGQCDPPVRYFRSEAVNCGGFAQESCSCGITQSSHLKLLGVFGAGTPTVPPPTISILNAPGTELGMFVNAEGGSRRGISRVELFVNGFKWGEAAGAPVGRTGQPNPSTYSLRVPDDLPDGILDLMVRAHDDSGASTDSAVVTARKGAPCAGAETCAKGQKCEEGKCFWDPPSGELGDVCEYNQFCINGFCRGTTETQICTQSCLPGVADSCPDELECVDAGGSGICFLPVEDTGCCSTTGGEPWGPFVLGAVSLAFVTSRRRRRRG